VQRSERRLKGKDKIFNATYKSPSNNWLCCSNREETFQLATILGSIFLRVPPSLLQLRSQLKAQSAAFQKGRVRMIITIKQKL
jgi:hypothetical protein